MDRRDFVRSSAAVAVSAQVLATAESKASLTWAGGHVFVYGSTPGGIAAAIEAARRGCAVDLVCPKMHPGGMTASGLCTTDAVRRELFGGLVLEFIEGVREDYLREMGENSPDWPLIRDGWFYEPSVAERVFQRMLEEEGERLNFLPGHHLVEAKALNGNINYVKVEAPDGKEITFTAQTHIDGTYEGDLAAAARVPFRVGREGRDEHGESLAGIHYMNWKSGEQILTPDTGEPSPAIQAFCARCIFTDDPEKIDNLLVPVALSSTHIAMSVLRMEPLWMTTGQVAGYAASVAKESGIDVANLDPGPMPEKLGIKVDAWG